MRGLCARVKTRFFVRVLLALQGAPRQLQRCSYSQDLVVCAGQSSELTGPRLARNRGLFFSTKALYTPLVGLAASAPLKQPPKETAQQAASSATTTAELGRGERWGSAARPSFTACLLAANERLKRGDGLLVGSERNRAAVGCVYRRAE